MRKLLNQARRLLGLGSRNSMRIQVAGELFAYPKMCGNPECQAVLTQERSLLCQNFEAGFWRCSSCAMSAMSREHLMPDLLTLPDGVKFPYPLACSAFYGSVVRSAAEQPEYHRRLVLERTLKPMISRDWPTLLPSVQHEMGRQVEDYLKRRLGPCGAMPEYLADRCSKLNQIVEGDLYRDIFYHLPVHGTVELLLEIQMQLTQERHQATAAISFYAIAADPV